MSDVWVVRRRRQKDSITQYRETYAKEGDARLAANKLVGNNWYVELEKVEMGRNHRLHIEVIAN